MMNLEENEDKVIQKPKMWIPLQRTYESLWGYFWRGLKNQYSGGGIDVVAVLRAGVLLRSKHLTTGLSWRRGGGVGGGCMGCASIACVS